MWCLDDPEESSGSLRKCCHGEWCGGVYVVYKLTAMYMWFLKKEM